MNISIPISDYNKSTTCFLCGSNKTTIQIRRNRGTPVWHNYENNKICNRCYDKLISKLNPEKKKIRNKKNSIYRLSFLGLHLFLSFELPKDICELCNKTKDEVLIHRHHYFYCRIMPWACTIPICNICHAKITNTGTIKVKSTTRTCLICNKTDYYKKIPNKYENGYICQKCYDKLRRTGAQANIYRQIRTAECVRFE